VWCEMHKFKFNYVFVGFIPEQFAMVEDTDLYFLQTHSDPSNFGHMIIDDLFSAYAAMDAFDVMTNKSRILMTFWSPCASGGLNFDFTSHRQASMNGRDISDWYVLHAILKLLAHLRHKHLSHRCSRAFSMHSDSWSRGYTTLPAVGIGSCPTQQDTRLTLTPCRH
jgi:hypothetical protein